VVSKTLVQDNFGNFKVIERIVTCENGRTVSRVGKVYTFKAEDKAALKQHMHSNYDTLPKEVDLAILCFEEKGHNKAEFGFWGGFMWTDFEGMIH